MRLFRYRDREHAHIGLGVWIDDGRAYRLNASDFMTLVLEARAAGKTTANHIASLVPGLPVIAASPETLELLTPLEAPEVWAAGVTYFRSREARNSEMGAHRAEAETCYDKVYEAARPELFLKSTAARTVGHRRQVCLRSDSSWQVPEPELGLVLDDDGVIVGYIVGNDMSCRDIEGANPLYLPQAKIWSRSCALGPFIRLAETVPDPYALTIRCRIYRDGGLVFDDSAHTGQLKRRFEELVGFLKRDNLLFDGTVLLTGTGLVPPDTFTLASGDRIEIDIETIGTLVNEAVYVHELERG